MCDDVLGFEVAFEYDLNADEETKNFLWFLVSGVIYQFPVELFGLRSVAPTTTRSTRTAQASTIRVSASRSTRTWSMLWRHWTIPVSCTSRSKVVAPVCRSSNSVTRQH